MAKMDKSLVSKGEQTRRRIIEVTIRLVSERGFSEVSFQDIADACHLSQSAALHHFKSKNGLIEAVIHTIVRHNHETVAALIKPQDHAWDRLLKHGTGNLLWAFEHRREAQIIILLHYLACYDKSFNRILMGVLETGQQRLEELLWAGTREKLFRVDGDVSDLAKILQQALFGAMFHAAALPKDKVSIKELEERWLRVASSLSGHAGR